MRPLCFVALRQPLAWPALSWCWCLIPPGHADPARPRRRPDPDPDLDPAPAARPVPLLVLDSDQATPAAAVPSMRP